MSKINKVGMPFYRVFPKPVSQGGAGAETKIETEKPLSVPMPKSPSANEKNKLEEKEPQAPMVEPPGKSAFPMAYKRKYNIGLAHRIFVVVPEDGKGITASALAEATQVDKANVTAILHFFLKTGKVRHPTRDRWLANPGVKFSPRGRKPKQENSSIAA